MTHVGGVLPGIDSTAVLAMIALCLAAQAWAAGGQAEVPAAPDAPAAARRNDAWKVIGMGGGGTMVHPLVSPHDPDLMLNACDMTGSYVSRDGGDSWRMFNLRSGTSCFAFDPSDENVIYAANAGLFRSKDKGETWELILPNVANNTFEYRRGDHGDYGFESDEPSYPSKSADVRITGVAVDPGDSNTVYVAFGGGTLNTADPFISVTRDGGKTFELLAQLEGNGVIEMAVPAKGAAPLAVHRAAVGTLVDGKWQLTPAPEGVSFGQASIGRGKDGLVIWAAAGGGRRGGGASGGVWVSKDLGMSWQNTGEAIAKAFVPSQRPPGFGAIACCSQNVAVCYVGYRGGSAPRSGPDGVSVEGPVSNGILKTEDGGATWRIVKAEGPEKPAPNAELSWQELRMHEGGSIWFDSPRNLCVAPTDPDICLATDLFRTCRTKDGGKSWDTITSADCGNGSWTTRGLDVTTCYGVHFDPFNKDNIFISYTDMGLWRSEDGGRTWMNSIEGIPGNWRNTCYWVEFDPEVKNLIWTAWSGTHDIPRPKMWRGRGWSRYRGGMATSTDGGKTWELTNSGIEQAAVTHVLLEPDSPVGKRTLYACAFARGVFRSDDNGRTWALKNKGIEKTDPFAWHIERTKEGALYLVVARRSDHGRTFTDDDDGALYISTDKAETWKKVNLPEGVNGPNGLHVDPEDSKRLYLAAWGKSDGRMPESGGGIYLSEDAGKTWKCVFDGDQHVYDVTHDPRTGRLYACGFEARARYSEDKGKTWKPIKGYNFHWGHRVVPDPLDQEKVYIATFGGSVWYGPATGDPDAAEDVVTPIPKKF